MLKIQLVGRFMPRYRYHIFTCINERTPDDPKGSCRAKGGREIHEAFKKGLKQKGLDKDARANKAGCLDQCAAGPVAVIYPEGVWYAIKTVEDVSEIIEQHIEKGQVVKRLLLKDR